MTDTTCRRSSIDRYLRDPNTERALIITLEAMKMALDWIEFGDLERAKFLLRDGSSYALEIAELPIKEVK